MCEILKCINWRIYWYIITYKKRVKPKNSTDHLLFCNHSESYDDFNILTCENITRIQREPVDNE